jgi:hypothetical protein
MASLFFFLSALLLKSTDVREYHGKKLERKYGRDEMKRNICRFCYRYKTFDVNFTPYGVESYGGGGRGGDKFNILHYTVYSKFSQPRGDELYGVPTGNVFLPTDKAMNNAAPTPTSKLKT